MKPDHLSAKQSRRWYLNTRTIKSSYTPLATLSIGSWRIHYVKATPFSDLSLTIPLRRSRELLIGISLRPVPFSLHHPLIVGLTYQVMTAESLSFLQSTFPFAWR